MNFFYFLLKVDPYIYTGFITTKRLVLFFKKQPLPYTEGAIEFISEKYVIVKTGS